MSKENVEEYLRKHSVLDGMGNMDGLFVPLSVAMIAVEQCLLNKLEYKGMSWVGNSNDIICKKIMVEVNRLRRKYPDGEFSCSPMFSPDKKYVSCNLCVDWKSHIYYYESDPVEELLKHLEGIN
jgi:hypothetical protein